LTADWLNTRYTKVRVWKMNDDRKSRTQKKNEASALQKLGEQLIALSSEQLERIDISDDLRNAVIGAIKTKSHGGNRALIEEILNFCPDAERQRLTQLARNARNEYEAEKGVKSSKILFRYLKQISGL
jgi:ribosomal 50S subunit-associated protein YjgA (DUF615 family)